MSNGLGIILGAALGGILILITSTYLFYRLWKYQQHQQFLQDSTTEQDLVVENGILRRFPPPPSQPFLSPPPPPTMAQVQIPQRTPTPIIRPPSLVTRAFRGGAALTGMDETKMSRTSSRLSTISYYHLPPGLPIPPPSTSTYPRERTASSSFLPTMTPPGSDSPCGDGRHESSSSDTNRMKRHPSSSSPPLPTTTASSSFTKRLRRQTFSGHTNKRLPFVEPPLPAYPTPWREDIPQQQHQQQTSGWFDSSPSSPSTSLSQLHLQAGSQRDNPSASPSLSNLREKAIRLRRYTSIGVISSSDTRRSFLDSSTGSGGGDSL